MILTSLNLFETKEFTHVEPKQKKGRMKNEHVHFLKRRMKKKDDVKNHPSFLSTRSFFSAIHLNGPFKRIVYFSLNMIIKECCVPCDLRKPVTYFEIRRGYAQRPLIHVAIN